MMANMAIGSIKYLSTIQSACDLFVRLKEFKKINYAKYFSKLMILLVI
jgi:hypothetical protein